MRTWDLKLLGTSRRIVPLGRNRSGARTTGMGPSVPTVYECGTGSCSGPTGERAMASSQAVPVRGNPSRSWAALSSCVLANSSSPAASLNDQSFGSPSRG